MIKQVCANPLLEVCRGVAVSYLGFGNLALPVARIPLVGVLALTEQADPLSRLALKRPVRELRERLGLAADAARSDA